MSARERESTHATGRRGEDLAVEFLTERGYQILDRNVHTPYGEIDCVAQHGDLLVFVEVKTRRSAAFGAPQEAVTDAKRSRLCRSAAVYLQERGVTDRPCRFDVVAIVSGTRPEIVHLPDAFTCDEPLL